MNFTELEYLLMLAVAVLLWRGSVLTRRADNLAVKLDLYANALVAIGKKKGRVVPCADSHTGFKFEEIK